MRYLIGLALTLVSFNALAVNWISADELYRDDYHIEVDLDSIKNINLSLLGSLYGDKYVSLFTQVIYEPDSKEYLEGIAKTKHYIYINCSKESYFLRSYIKYDTLGNSSDSGGVEPISINEFDAVFPDTLMEPIFKLSCQK